MLRIFVCSPYRGDVAGNVAKAMAYCRMVIAMGHLPYAPHLFLTRFLDDANPIDREQGLRLAKCELALCHELWAFGPATEGMQGEIDFARRMGILVRFHDAADGDVPAFGEVARMGLELEAARRELQRERDMAIISVRDPFGAMLMHMRLEAKKSLTEAGALIGEPGSLIQAWEVGAARPTFDQLEELVTSYDRPAYQLAAIWALFNLPETDFDAITAADARLNAEAAVLLERAELAAQAYARADHRVGDLVTQAEQSLNGLAAAVERFEVSTAALLGAVAPAVKEVAA